MSNNTPSTHSSKRNFTMKQHVLVLAVLAAFGMVSTVQAEVQSGISNNNAAINVGSTEGDSGHPPGGSDLPGIGHSSLHDGKRVSFASLQALGTNSSTGEPSNWTRTKIDPTVLPVPPDHANIGYFDFVQVASEAVYFGEWSQNDNAGDSTYTVYYAGQAGNVVNTLPVQTATYTVVGINQGNSLAGSLTANFGGDNTLTGALFNSSLTIDIVAAINSSDASFSGAAFANTGNGFVDGESKGHFFGDAAAALAGIATFGDVSLNTAFGGAKD